MLLCHIHFYVVFVIEFEANASVLGDTAVVV